MDGKLGKVLVVDDDENICEVLNMYLKSSGYDTRVVYDGKRAQEEFINYKPDLVILDVMLPGKDGIEVLKYIRKSSDVPVIMLTAKGEIFDKVLALELGADDYMVKPYSLRELRARIDVLLRRFAKTQQVPNNNLIQIQNLTIDKIAHKAIFQGEDLGLANREYEVLLYLAEHPNQEVTFEELGTALFGYYQDSDRRSVMVNVSRLRKKFENNYELKNMIETVWSKGYRLIMK